MAGYPREDETAMSPPDEKGKTMIGYVDIAEQVDADFSRSVRKAFVHRLGARLRGNPSSSRAPSFEEAAKALDARNKMRIGRRTVAVEEIVGSVGRSGDFDEDFLPVRRGLEERWKRVDRAFHRGIELPPVTLYELGGRYFVLDGNHRVSVARYQGVQWIEAEVTRVHGNSIALATIPAAGHETSGDPQETAQLAA
jgi:hypothetical protein